MILTRRLLIGAGSWAGRPLDVNLPGRVEGVRHVDPHPSKLGQLHLSGQPEPCAVDDQPLLPVHVEPLILQVAFRTGIPLPVRRADLAVMGKREGPNDHIRALDAYSLLGPRDRRQVGGVKWVEGLKWTFVQKDPDLLQAWLSREESVEHEFKVGSSLIKPTDEVALGPRCLLSSATSFSQTTSVPDCPSSSAHGMAAVTLRELNQPLIGLGDVVQIPPRAERSLLPVLVTTVSALH